jgi:DNA-binding MarR family transcriptional regulator
MIIDYPDASQIEIAERVFKDKASITRIIDLLMRDGYLMRQKNEQDARKSRLQLTKKGKITMQRLNKLVPSFRKDALKGIGPNEIRVALQLIRKLGYNCS